MWPSTNHSRVSFACIQPGETAHSACSALVDTLRYFQTLGVAFTRVMTDNGSCYRSKHFAKLCRRLKLRHIRTRPYTPRTNGKSRSGYTRDALSQVDLSDPVVALVKQGHYSGVSVAIFGPTHLKQSENRTITIFRTRVTERHSLGHL